jgi:hypothetical protein
MPGAVIAPMNGMACRITGELNIGMALCPGGWTRVLRMMASWKRASMLNRSASTAALALLAGVVIAPAAPAMAGDNMMDQMVRKFCLKAVNDEVKASGKPAPEGMAETTCDCVVQEMKKRKTVEQAKDTCKTLAAQKYNL